MSSTEAVIERKYRKFLMDTEGLEGVERAAKDGRLDYAIAREGGMDYATTPKALQRLFDLYLSVGIEKAVQAAGITMKQEHWDVSTPDRKRAFQKYMTPIVEEHAMSLACYYLDQLKDKNGNDVPAETFKALLRWKAEQELTVSDADNNKTHEEKNDLYEN